MAKTTRTKPTPLMIADINAATGAVAEMAAIDRQKAVIEAAMNEAIDAARAKAAAEAAGLDARRKELANAVTVYAKFYKGELFTDAKTLDLGYGKIGFRLSNPSLVLERGVTEAMCLGRLRDYGLLEGIRTKESLARDVMLGWPKERLEVVGLIRKQSDDFFIEITPEAVPEEA